MRIQFSDAKAVAPAAALYLLYGCMMVAHVTVAAQTLPEQTASTQTKTPEQPNDCVTAAATFHGVNPWVVRAILKVESNFKPTAVNRNRNGSIDVGIAQINSIHFKELAKHGIAPAQLMDACTGAYVAAWHLKKQVNSYGNSWFAIGAYNSTTPCYNHRYSSLVWNTLQGWKVIDGGKLAGPSMSQCDALLGRGANSNALKPSNPGGSLLAFDSN